MNALEKALANTSVHWFDYDVPGGVCVIPERTAARFGTGTRYENMPYSFANDFVFGSDMPDFVRMYGAVQSGAETASALFRNKSGENWCKVTMTVTARDGDGAPLRAVGIIEDQSASRNNEMRYSKWLAALGEMYHVRCYINLIDRTYMFIEGTWGGLPEKGSSQGLAKGFAEKFVYPEDRDEYLKKLDAGYIRSRLNTGNRSFSVEYRQKDELEEKYRWVRGTVIASDFLADGSVSHVLYTVQYIDDEVEERVLLESSLSLIRDTYYRIGCIDLNRNSMRTLTISDSERGEVPGFREDFDKAVRQFAGKYILKEYREKFLNVMLPERMKNNFDDGLDYIDITYQRLESGVPKWVRTELIPLSGYSKESRRVMWYVKNISHEKAVEDRLTQKLLRMNNDVNLRLETILNGVAGGFKISNDDEKFSFRFVSESAAALFGYTVEEFCAAKRGCALENVYPDDRDRVMKELLPQLAKGDSYSVKYRVLCRDGSIKWIVDSGKRVLNEDGESMFYSLYHDVTDMEKRNIELRDALTMLDRIMQSVSCGIFAYRVPRRTVLTFNDEAKRLFDYRDDDGPFSMNRVVQDKLYPEDAAAMLNTVKSLRNPGDSVMYEFRIKHRDGAVRKVQVNSRMLEFEDGGRFILSSMLDITKQAELTDIIIEERSQYRDALLTNCEYCYSFDLTEGYITEEYITKHGVNPFQKMGMTVPVLYDDFINRWVETFKPQFLTDDMRSSMSRDVLLKMYAGGDRTGEVEYYSPVTGIYTRVTALMSRSDRNGHVMAVIVGTDTTRSRKAEEQTRQALQDAYEAARRASTAKSDFLSRMSHDIRTPMNAIIGMTAIAGTHLDDKERVADCLNKITVSSSHLLSLINEILDMSKIESGKVDLNEEEFNLSDLVDALIAMIRPQIKAKNQELHVKINDVVHEKVVGDKLRIQQSFLNFMSNAIKYTPEGGRINLYITEKTRPGSKAGRYEFIFEDTGIGMSREFVEHIFEPFARASDSRVSKEQGTGLGLAIAENLVRMMNGNIKVESEEGKGSRFTVTISLKLQDTEELSYEAFTDLPVLVADDDEGTCENTCRMLEELGMLGEWVTDGQTAVERVVYRHEKEDDYFAVILDWKMPGMDGVQATREIRRLIGPEVPIIIISAYDWSDIELEARAAGADAFIGKPLFKSRLAHLFHEMLSGDSETTVNTNADDLAKEDFSGNRVLLVEDNELNAEIAQELLEMAGLTVETAENGQIAVDMFGESEPGYYQMIFMDIQMPVMNGNEAARAIRALPRRDAKGIPIIAMTANAFSEDVQMSREAGMNEHLPKPLDLKQLVRVLKTWLN